MHAETKGKLGKGWSLASRRKGHVYQRFLVHMHCHYMGCWIWGSLPVQLCSDTSDNPGANLGLSPLL